MKWYINKNRLEKAKLAKLADRLADFDLRPTLNDEEILQQKNSLMNQIKQENLVENLKLMNEKVVLNNYQKHNLRKSLLAKITADNVLAKKKFWRNLQTSLAATSAFAISLGIFSVMPLDFNLTKASKWTFLEEIKGEVFVNRNGQVLSVDQNFALEEGDLLITRADSFVVVRFLDDSVARLGENTSLEIKKLYLSEENQTTTEIQLALKDGQAWTNVVNLVDNNSVFVIETDQALASVSSSASFEIKASKENTSIEVFNNVVDFKSKNLKVAETKPIVSGYKATIENSKKYQISLNDNEILVDKSEISSEWSVMNRELDEKYQGKLREENQKFAQQTLERRENFGGILYDIRNTTDAIFSDSEADSLRREFLSAHLGFLKAQKMMSDQRRPDNARNEALKLAYEYRRVVRDIAEKIPTLKVQKDVQIAQVELLEKTVRDHLNDQRKNLYSILPDEEKYFLKNILLESGTYFTFSDYEKVDFHLKKAQITLMEVQRLIDKESFELAASAFNRYLNQLTELVEVTADVNILQFNQNLLEIINAQIKQVKMFNSIVAKLEGKADISLLTEVKSAKKASLVSLLSLAEEYQAEIVSWSMLMEIKSLVEDYFEDEAEKIQLLGRLENLMKLYVEYEDYSEEKTAEIKLPEQILEMNLGFDATVATDAAQEVGEISKANELIEIEKTLDAKN